MTPRTHLTRAVVAAATCALAACAGDLGPSAPSAQIDIRVAPLDLEGVSNVCYGLAVFPAGEETPVWEQPELCSEQYGDGAGGGISYVGPCDAQAADHTVQLWIDRIIGEDDDPLPADDWRNPCEAPDGCTQSVTCVANADAAVDFDITVMRRARQGFFDIAVDFEDVFCSAKVDCAYDDLGEDPIELLFDADGERAQTVVVALACTSGPGEGGATHLHMSPVGITCRGDESSFLRSQVEPIAGACFDVGADRQVTGALVHHQIIRESAQLAPGSSGDPELASAQLLAQHVVRDGGTVDANVASIAHEVPMSGGTRTFDGAAVFGRLGDGVGLAFAFDRVEGVPAVAGPVGAASELVLGTVFWDDAAQRWEWGEVLGASAGLGFTPTHWVPQHHDADHLVAYAARIDGGGEQVGLVYPWDAVTHTYGAPTMLTPPATDPGLGEIVAQGFAGPGLRDGAVLWERVYAGGERELFVASADDGWALTQLAVPADVVVPAGYLHAGAPVVAGPTFSGQAVQVHGQRVIAEIAVEDGVADFGSVAPMLGLFTPDGAGGWSFAVHPVHDGQTGAATAWPTAAARHYLTTLTGGAGPEMIRIYEASAGGADDVLWDRYAPLTEAAGVQTMSVAGVIERQDGPSLAVFEYRRSDEEFDRVELGVLAGDGGEVTPLVAIAGPAEAATAWELRQAYVAGDTILLEMEGTASGGGGFGGFGGNFSTQRYTFRATVGQIPSVELVSVASVDLGKVTTTPGSGLLDGVALAPGDETRRVIAGGCDHLGGFVGAATVDLTQASSLMTSYTHLAVVDFDEAPEAGAYTATALPYSDATRARVEEAAAEFAGEVGYEGLFAAAPEGGNQLDPAAVPTTDPVFQHAVYMGAEELGCGGVPCNKVYYNTAIGFEPTHANCTLTWVATASGPGGAIDGDGYLSDGAVYPVIVAEVPLTGDDPDSDGLLCRQHPVLGGDVEVVYTDSRATGVRFCSTWDGAELTVHESDPRVCAAGLRTIGRVQESVRDRAEEAEAEESEAEGVEGEGDFP